MPFCTYFANAHKGGMCSICFWNKMNPEERKRKEMQAYINESTLRKWKKEATRECKIFYDVNNFDQKTKLIGQTMDKNVGLKGVAEIIYYSPHWVLTAKRALWLYRKCKPNFDHHAFGHIIYSRVLDRWNVSRGQHDPLMVGYHGIGCQDSSHPLMCFKGLSQGIPQGDSAQLIQTLVERIRNKLVECKKSPRGHCGHMFCGCRYFDILS